MNTFGKQTASFGNIFIDNNTVNTKQNLQESNASIKTTKEKVQNISVDSENCEQFIKRMKNNSPY